MGIYVAQTNVNLQEHLIHLWDSQKLPQVQLFECQNEETSKAFVTDLAKKIFCEKKQHCGLCTGCQRMDLGVHPDFFIVSQDSAVIKVQDVERALTHLKDFATLTPFVRIVILCQIEKLHHSAFHKLLKSLEEPYPHNLILMTTGRKGIIPQTLLSRTFVWQLDTEKKEGKLSEDKEKILYDLLSSDSALAVIEKAEKLGKIPVKDLLCEVERWINQRYRECLKAGLRPSKALQECRLYMNDIRKKSVPLSSGMVAEVLGFILKSSRK